MNETKNNRLKFPKMLTRKNVMIIMGVSIFFGSIIYMQLGNSIHGRYINSENPVSEISPPQNFQIPFANNANLTGGFNVSNDFISLPGFDIPPELIDQFPSSFGNGTFGGIPTIDPISGIDPPAIGGGGGGPIDIPNIDPPSPPGGVTPPSNGGSGGGGLQPPELTPGNSGSSSGNQTFNPSSDKARNLPKLNFFDFGGINLNFLNFEKLLPVNDVGAMSYIIILLSALFLNGNFIPLFFKRIDEFDDSGTRGESMFFVPKMNLEAMRKKKERIRKLLLFRDHVDELIERSKQRLVEENASTTIIIGYHELDAAFSAFANLVRSKDITPLEHANSHFYDDEISNEILERIVALFYLSRYGRRDLEEKYGYLFIDLLGNLIVTNPEFMEGLESIDQTIPK